MKYNVTIYDCPTGWVKNETTNDRARLFELRNEAAAKARECVKFMGRDNTREKHFVYYYELPEFNWKGLKTGNVDVRVSLLPYMCDDDTFHRFVDESKPYFVGAIHGNNLCSKFFEK